MKPHTNHLFIGILASLLSYSALGSQIQLNCTYRAEGETKLRYETLKEMPPTQADFKDGEYIVQRHTLVEALGTCVERADALSVVERNQYFVVGLAGYELGRVWNGRYYPVFHSGHMKDVNKENINADNAKVIKGREKVAAADQLFPASLIISVINKNEDTFANAYIDYEKGASVKELITERTRQDLPRFDVYFDAYEGGKFVSKYEHFLDSKGACQVKQAGKMKKNCSQEDLEYTLPSEVMISALTERDLNRNQADALIEKLRFSLDTRYRTQEFESYALAFARTARFKPKEGMIQLSTRGFRQHNFLIKGDRFIMHSEIEYMFDHLDTDAAEPGQEYLGTLVTVRAQRVMVFNLQDLSTTKEHMFISRDPS